MIIILHVCIALLSIAYTTFTYLRPAAERLHVAYWLVALTVVSGVYLLWAKPAHMAETCMVGLLYLVGVSWGIIAARHRLAALRATNNHRYDDFIW